MGYAAESPLCFAHKEASHTHTFDDRTTPFHSDPEADREAVKGKLLHKVEILDPVPLRGLALLIVLGGLVPVFDRGGRLDARLVTAQPTSDRTKAVWNRDVPGPVLGVFALAGLVVFSVVARYIYDPPPEKGFDEIVQVRT